MSLVDNKGGTLYLLTNRDAPNGRLVTVDAANPGRPTGGISSPSVSRC